MDETSDPRPLKNGDDMNEDYANNSFFEPTIWDLKMLFGEWSGRSKSVEWHTSITVPWPQAKLIAYYLQVNLAIHEVEQGKIRVPDSMIPADFPDVPAEMSNPEAKELVASLRRLRQNFIDSLK